MGLFLRGTITNTWTAFFEVDPFEMGKRRVSAADNPSKDREDSWKETFTTLVDLIQDQQRQLETLVKERKFLEKRIQLQHDRWAFDVKLLKDHISQVQRDLKFKDMLRFVDAAKANLIISMTQKQAIKNKRKFEEVDDERFDLKLLFDEVSQLLADPKRVTRSSSKDVDVPALKAERNFAWKQYHETDNKLQELQELLKRTKVEAEAANDKVEKLTADLEQSQSLIMEKNRTISALKDDIVLLESNSRKKTEEISRLTKELELLRSDSSRSITPVLRRCMVESKNREGGSNHSSGLAITDKTVRSSKRKAIETKPRLFTHKFKVPKLKT